MRLLVFHWWPTTIQYQGRTDVRWRRVKKQVWRPMVEPKVFREKMYCIEEITCHLGRLFCASQLFSSRRFLPLAPLSTLHKTSLWQIGETSFCSKETRKVCLIVNRAFCVARRTDNIRNTCVKIHMTASVDGFSLFMWEKRAFQG